MKKFVDILSWGLNKHKLIVGLFFFSLFVYFFSPKFAFFPVDYSFVLALFCIIFICYKTELLVQLKEHVWIFLSLYGIFSFWFLFGGVQSNSISINSFSFIAIRLVIEVVLPSYILSYYIVENNVDLIKIFQVFIIMQVVITIIQLNPSIKRNFYEKIIELDEYTAMCVWLRVYGLGRNYLSWFPSAVSFMCVYLFINYIFTRNVKSLVIMLFGNIVLLLNTRTSLLIEFIAIIIIMNYYYVYVIIDNKKIVKKKKTIREKFFLFLLFLSVVIFSIYILNKYKEFFENIVEWLLSALKAFSNLLNGTSENDTFSDLNKWFMPDTFFECLFGTGQTVYKGQRSDIGYVNYFAYGGFLYSILVYAFYAYLGLKSYNYSNNTNDKIFVVCVFPLLFLLNYKGPVFGLNETIRLCFFMYFYFYHKRRVTVDNHKRSIK